MARAETISKVKYKGWPNNTRDAEKVDSKYINQMKQSASPKAKEKLFCSVLFFAFKMYWARCIFPDLKKKNFSLV